MHVLAVPLFCDATGVAVASSDGGCTDSLGPPSLLAAIFMIVFIEVSSAHQGCIYLIKNTVHFYKYCEILLQFQISVFYVNIC